MTDAGSSFWHAIGFESSHRTPGPGARKESNDEPETHIGAAWRQSGCRTGRPEQRGCLAGLTGAAAEGVVSWPAPAGEVLSEHYEVTVEGQPVPVYACRVSAIPFNQVWPGYQRPLDQTELAGFACWDMAEPVKVVVQSRRPVKSVVVRPMSLGIRPAVEANRITFSLTRPGPVIVEVNGPHHALHLFASPPEEDAPAPDAPGVRYFGPGVHRAGKIDLKSNETVYIAGGAVVYGSLNAHGASGIRIAGRGILDVEPLPAGRRRRRRAPVRLLRRDRRGDRDARSGRVVLQPVRLP